MRISPVNNVSFGKLYLNQGSETKQIMADIVKNQNIKRDVKEALTELSNVSGDRPVFLSAEKGKDYCDTPCYMFFLNKGDSDWEKATCSMKTYDKPEKILDVIENLTTSCKETIRNINRRAEQSDIDDLFEEFKSPEEN